MKTLIIALFLLPFSALVGITTSSIDTPFVFDKQVANSCPLNHEKAEIELEAYLAKESNIEDLRTNYEFDVNLDSHNEIQALDQDKYDKECKKLMNNLSENDRHHSFYKVADSYFVVNYSIAENKDFEYKSITLIDSDFEIVGFVINFSGTLY